MLLLHDKWGAESKFAVWEAVEDESFFSENLPLTESEIADLSRHQYPQRRKEWLAGRYLLHRITGATERYPLEKSLYSKPFFVGDTNLNCSLSHSKGTVGAFVSPYPCGCDLQVIVDKMERIAPKFMRPDEMDFANAQEDRSGLLMQHIFWTAKEALYKAYGLKELDFRKHLYLEPFEWSNTHGTVEATGWIKTDAIEIPYHLHIGYFEADNELPEFVWTTAEKIM
jgi:4'-phosphopantetheinyl transferase